jgi:hypothetical protein
MNASEQKIVGTYGQQWVDAIDRQTAAMDRLVAAVKYMADVIGFKADDANPKDAEGKAQVLLEINQPLPQDDEPLADAPTYTLEDIRKALNAFAKKAGKDPVMEILVKYAQSGKPADINPDQYSELMREIS